MIYRITPNNADSEASKQRQHAAHLRENDRLLANLQKALELVDSITSIDPFVKDEWYLRKNQDARTVTEIRTTHPYSKLSTTPSPQDPQDQEKPDDSFMDIQLVMNVLLRVEMRLFLIQ